MVSNIAKENNGEMHELRGLFEKQLKELFWAENNMLTVLSAIILQSYSKDLVKAVEKIRTEKITHVNRLEKLFAISGLSASEQRYEAVECIINETEKLIHATAAGVVRDAGVIALMQKMLHFKIACYGTMKAYAMALREEEAIALLEATLAEEKLADFALTNIAESHINTEAADKEI